MKIKLTLVSLLSFFFLVFLIHELHDWAHFLTAAMFCGCLGDRAFDSWAPCTLCNTSTTGLAIATLMGPLVNYLVLWSGWGLMHPDNPPEKQSMGFALVFAAMPFPRILGAAFGGGDETSALRMLFQHGDSSNHKVVAGVGLLIVFLLCLPALIRAFVLVTGWLEKLLLVPAFLILPGLMDHWLVSGQLNRLMGKGFLNHQMLRGGTRLFVFVWLIVVLPGYLMTRKKLESLLEYKELSV